MQINFRSFLNEALHLRGLARESKKKKNEAHENGTCVPLKRQPAPPRDAHRENQWKEPEPLEPLPMNSWSDTWGKKKKKTSIELVSPPQRNLICW